MKVLNDRAHGGGGKVTLAAMGKLLELGGGRW